MIIKQLRVTNLRAFREAEFNFNPGMNLLVGINGVGKSTVLDAIRILLSQMMPRISDSIDKPIKFTDDNISINKNFLSAKLVCEFRKKSLDYSIQNYHNKHKPNTKEEKLQAKFSGIGMWVFPKIDTREEKPSSEKVNQAIETQFLDIRLQKPLAIFFSPYRSIIKTSKIIKNNIFPQYTEALKPRQNLNLDIFIDWWLACKKLAEENYASAQSNLKTLEDMVSQFLGCYNLCAVTEPKKTLLIEKSGVTLDVKQLSDGERGILALVLDLTRRLAQANPYLDNPAKDGKAIVLIDELDLHLHPKWQRTIVNQLTSTFPNCQFIATTHSPQIISEVQPEALTFLVREGDQVLVKPATQAYGLDTNWILDHLMHVPSRPKPVQGLIDQVEDFLQEGELESARKILEQLRQILHGVDGDVIRLEASVDTLEALRDEVDSEEE